MIGTLGNLLNEFDDIKFQKNKGDFIISWDIILGEEVQNESFSRDQYKQFKTYLESKGYGMNPGQESGNHFLNITKNSLENHQNA